MRCYAVRHSVSATPMAGLKVGSWSWRRWDEHFPGKTNPFTPARPTAETVQLVAARQLKELLLEGKRVLRREKLGSHG